MNEKHKLVPVEPTREMWAAAGDAVVALNSHHHDAISEAVYKAMIAAAPEAQMEVVGWQFYQDGKWWNGDDRIRDLKRNAQEAGFRVRDVYVAQQPAEQPAEQPAPEAGEHRKFTFWVVYDATSDQKYIKMDISTGCLAIFDIERRAASFAADYPGADYKELVLYSCPQPADAALVVEQKPADKPEVVAWRWRKPIVNDHGETVGATDWNLTESPGFLPWWQHEPLIRLSDYAALHAECEKLRSIISDLKDFDCEVGAGCLSIPWHLRRRMQEAIDAALAAHRKQGGDT